MTGRIPPEFIDDLLARADIVELIDARIQLKKAGREYKGLCPFHNEKTPSFMVSPAKQFYHCFGCGAHGTAIGFLMEYENLGFRDAVEELAARYGLQLPAEAAPAPGQRQQADLYGVMAAADSWFQQQLRSGPGSETAKDYLKGRGLSGQVAARFGLGYAPQGWELLITALTGQGMTREQLKEAGLVSVNDQGRIYDKFRHRIMFPIHDRRGRVIAFGGRVLDDGEPKYLNSPETPLFHKGQALYGLYLARDAIREAGKVIVVEGYMDVIALAQAGIEYAVAALGTATTASHVEQLFRTCDEIVFCFDGDRAGRRAAWRALENTLPVMRDGKQAGFLFLPEGEDPDSLVRRIGADAFAERVAHEVRPLPDYLLEQLASEVDLTRLDGRARLAELARPLIGSQPDGALREVLTQRLAELTRLDSERLGQLLQPENQPQETASVPSRKTTRRQPHLSRALELLLHQPGLAAGLTDTDGLEHLDLPGMETLARVISLARSRPGMTSSAIIERFRETPYHERLLELAGSRIEADEAALATELTDVITRLRLMAIDQETGQLAKRSTRLNEEEKQRLRKLYEEKQRLETRGGRR